MVCQRCLYGSRQATHRFRADAFIRNAAKRRNVSYADLAEKLAAVGVKDNERNIANKIARGSFTAVFFVQCLEAIGAQTIHLNGS